ERGEKFFVAPDERRLRDDADGVSKLKTDFETRARQLVIRFERQIRVGCEREDDCLPLPTRSHELRAQQLRRTNLCDDLRLEVRARAEAEVFVRRSAETITASVRAASVAVDRIIKPNVGAVVVRDD